LITDSDGCHEAVCGLSEAIGCQQATKSPDFHVLRPHEQLRTPASSFGRFKPFEPSWRKACSRSVAIWRRSGMK
jgi:hypothetical protein